MSVQTNVSNDRVPWYSKLGIGFGDFGNQFTYTFINIFLMYYFTDVALIGATIGGMILFIARGWDAFWDVVMGWISDHTKTRWGSKRPYILFGSIPLAVMLYLLFAAPDFAKDHKFAYYLVVSLVLWTVYTVVTIPQNALIPALTQDSHERSVVTGFKIFGTLIAVIIIGAATKPLVGALGNGSEVLGFRMVGLIYAVIIFLSMAFVFFSTKEKYQSESDYHIFKSFELIRKNKPFLIIAGAGFMGFITTTVVASTINYYFKYVMKDETFIPIAFTCIFGVSALCIPLWVLFSKKFGKKLAFMISSFVFGFVFLPLFFLKSFDMTVMITVFIISGISYSGVNLCQWSLIPDTVEYAECNMGIRCEGIIYGVYTFILKLAVAVGSVIIGVGLDLSGYVPNVPQSESALLGIRVLMCIVPFIVILVSVIIIKFYPITEESHKAMISELDKRKAECK